MVTNLDEISALIAIVDTGSLTAAADRLGQTTSGLSRTLSRLEGKLGVTLLRRTTRRLDLTSEGETFLAQGRMVIAQLEQAEDSVSRRDVAPSGVLRVDSASPFVLHVIVPFLKEFNDLYPKIEIELHSSEHNIDLIERRIDIAIRIGKLTDSTLHAMPLGTTLRRVLASPAYLKEFGTPRTVADLSKHRLLGFTHRWSLNDWPLRSSDGRGGTTDSYSIRPFLSTSSGETQLHLVRAGAGIACLSDFMTRPERRDGSLVQVLKSAAVEQRQDIHAVYYKGTQMSPRALAFTQFLKKKMKS